MFTKTFSKMTSMFSTMRTEIDDVFKTMEEEMNEEMKPSGPLPDGTTETVTEETETKPDGTVIRRKVTRRTSVTKK